MPPHPARTSVQVLGAHKRDCVPVGPAGGGRLMREACRNRGARTSLSSTPHTPDLLAYAKLGRFEEATATQDE